MLTWLKLEGAVSINNRIEPHKMLQLQGHGLVDDQLLPADLHGKSNSVLVS